jgi:hypothetical protein
MMMHSCRGRRHWLVLAHIGSYIPTDGIASNIVVFAQPFKPLQKLQIRLKISLRHLFDVHVARDLIFAKYLLHQL